MPIIFSQAGKKPRTREGICKPEVPKERHITIPEVSPERTRTASTSPQYHVEA